jgi:hypothetical protein
MSSCLLRTTDGKDRAHAMRGAPDKERPRAAGQLPFRMDDCGSMGRSNVSMFTAHLPCSLGAPERAMCTARL